MASCDEAELLSPPKGIVFPLQHVTKWIIPFTPQQFTTTIIKKKTYLKKYDTILFFVHFIVIFHVVEGL